MARPDLSAERSEQILDAFSRCVARSGLDAVSLEEVAGEAGVRRSIIRHYIGNRDDLVAAFLDRLEVHLQRQNDDMRTWFIANPGVGGLPHYLFWDAPDDALPVLESVLLRRPPQPGDCRPPRELAPGFRRCASGCLARLVSRCGSGCHHDRCPRPCCHLQRPPVDADPRSTASLPRHGACGRRSADRLAGDAGETMTLVFGPSPGLTEGSDA